MENEIMKMKQSKFAAFVAVTFSAIAAQTAFGGVALVRDGKPSAEIVLGSGLCNSRDKNQAEAHQWAADELQRWIAAITGAYLPIVRNDRPAGAKVRVVLQAKDAAKLFPKDFKAIGGTDGYAIRTREIDGVTEIHLFGSCPHGTLNAAFAFLEANSDIIWPRPDPEFEAVYSKSRDFTAAKTDVLDVPLSRYRHRQWDGRGDFSNCRQADWAVRNRENDISRGLARHAPMMVGGGYGHGISVFAKEKENFEKHPEWFTLFNGERTPKTGWVCFCSDPEGLSDEFVKNIKLELDRRFPGVKPADVKVDFFNLSGADNWNVCQCEACTKPFVCEDGKVVDPKDPAFRSAQCFTFMNKIMRKLRKTHPKVVLGNYAYYITETPPPFRLDPNIRIQFCPYGENMKAPLDDPKANTYPARLLKAWGVACDKVCYRSYSGCGMNFPRQTEYIVQTNLLACLNQPLPIREFMDESHADLMTHGRGGDCLQWNMCAMECWVNNRLWWNPKQDLESLRRQFVTRAYQEAAEPMSAYHDLLRDAYYSDRLTSNYNSINPVAYTSHYIVEKGHAGKLLALLDEALAKVKNPVSREMIRRHREFFGKWIAEAEKKTYVSMTVPYSDAKDLATSFDSEVWDKAGDTGDFVTAKEGYEGRGQKPKFRTTAKILHDRSAFYVKFDCYAPDMKTLKVSQLKPGSTSDCPRGDVVEFYFANADDGVYWMSIMDAGNPGEPEKDAVYFARLSDSSWRGGWTRRVKRYDDRWTMIVRVPFDSLGLAAAQNFRVLFQAIRQKYYPDEERVKAGKKGMAREFSSWNGGFVHSVDDFGELKLGM